MLMTIRGLEALTVSNKRMVFFQVCVDFLDLIFIWLHKVNKFYINNGSVACIKMTFLWMSNVGPITISTIWQSGWWIKHCRGHPNVMTVLIKYLIILQDPNLAKERLQCSLKRPSYTTTLNSLLEWQNQDWFYPRKYYSNRAISLLFINNQRWACSYMATLLQDHVSVIVILLVPNYFMDSKRSMCVAHGWSGKPLCMTA